MLKLDLKSLEDFSEKANSFSLKKERIEVPPFKIPNWTAGYLIFKVKERTKLKLLKSTRVVGNEFEAYFVRAKVEGSIFPEGTIHFNLITFEKHLWSGLLRLLMIREDIISEEYMRSDSENNDVRLNTLLVFNQLKEPFFKEALKELKKRAKDVKEHMDLRKEVLTAFEPFLASTAADILEEV